MSKNIDRIAFELWCGLDSVAELETWAAAELRKDDSYYDAKNLFRLDKETATNKAIEIAEELGDFNIQSETCKTWAKEIALRQYQIYLTGKVTPYSFCEFIKTIDALFIDQPMYPDWLGSLYYDCDWCDETWTFHRDYAIAEEVERLLIDTVTDNLNH